MPDFLSLVGKEVTLAMQSKIDPEGSIYPSLTVQYLVPRWYDWYTVCCIFY